MTSRRGPALGSAGDRLSRAGVDETARLTATGDLTARAVVEESLARIAALDPGLNAFSRVLADEARAEAAARDEHLAGGGAPGPLHGVPIAIKEEIDVAGTVTTFGGEANVTPAAADAEIVRRLREAGRSSSARRRCRSSGRSPTPSRPPGGSPATRGTAAGPRAAPVAVRRSPSPPGWCRSAIGGDGGGSIRIPSACCGLFGLKPQRGRVTTAPSPHLWWALGTAGPLTRSVRDSALVYDVIRGNVEGDLYRAGDTESFVEAAEREPGRLRIGWTTKPVTRGVRPDPVHVRAVEDTARLLADLGPRRPRGRPALPRPDRRVRPAVLRRHPLRGRRASSTTTGSSGVPARPTGSAPG